MKHGLRDISCSIAGPVGFSVSLKRGRGNVCSSTGSFDMFYKYILEVGYKVGVGVEKFLSEFRTRTRTVHRAVAIAYASVI